MIDRAIYLHYLPFLQASFYNLDSNFLSALSLIKPYRWLRTTACKCTIFKVPFTKRKTKFGVLFRSILHHIMVLIMYFIGRSVVLRI